MEVGKTCRVSALGIDHRLRGTNERRDLRILVKNLCIPRFQDGNSRGKHLGSKHLEHGRPASQASAHNYPLRYPDLEILQSFQ